MSSSSSLPELRCLKARWGACAGTVWTSPLGPVELLASASGLRLVEFLAAGDVPDGEPPAPTGDDGTERSPERAAANDVLAQAVSELAEYFAGRRRTFTVPLDLEGTPFQRSVWKALSAIPYGTTITYRELAAAAGRPAAIRAAGAANGANPLSIVIPCHRVVGSDGELHGYAGGIGIKRALIDLERGGSDR